MRVIFFGAHPDDVERHCGGTIALLIQHGYEVWIISLSAGEKGTHGTARIRRQESKKAASILGAKSRVLYMPDTAIAVTDKNRKVIASFIRTIKPTIVFAQYWEVTGTVFGAHAHPDHLAAGQLVKETLFLSNITKFSIGKPHRVQRLYYYMLPSHVLPNMLVPISDAHMEKAFCAIRAHASQIPHDTAAQETLMQRLRSFRMNTDRDTGVLLPKGFVYTEKYLAAFPFVISPDTVAALFP